MLLFIPGTGIFEPILNTTSIKSVNISFFLNSGILQAFDKVGTATIGIHGKDIFGKSRHIAVCPVRRINS